MSALHFADYLFLVFCFMKVLFLISATIFCSSSTTVTRITGQSTKSAKIKTCKIFMLLKLLFASSLCHSIFG